ncbi:MAG: zinc-dependent metalloprotease [Propioniciclava sp.]|uniref:zinc-dependent metalloprotease n=1 Tax=Propioniciclava sp. TaxID=2038686 RepID=UPI0039E45AC1
MPSVPLIDARAAIAVGAGVIPPGPVLTPAEAAEVVAGLRAAALASVRPVAEVTGLGAIADGPMRVVDRRDWLRANVEMTLTMLAEAGDGPDTPPATAWQRAEAHANGAQLGGLFAALGTRILGQYLPFAAEPSLLLVAPNVAQVERVLGVRPADFRLWVCLHEQTHRLQFARAPWLRGHLIGEMSLLLADDDHAEAEARPERRKERPRSLLDLAATPEQQRVIGRVGAAMSLLEGYADDMMDRVGPAVVPTVDSIRARFERRRHRGGWVAVLNRLMSMDLKLAQYRDGARFCRAVIDRVGVDGLNVVYDAPAHLPSPQEIADPARWMARVHG